MNYPKKLTIDVGMYCCMPNIPRPKCDSCKENVSTHKVYTDNVGIRLCKDCLDRLKKKIEELKQ